MLLSCIFMYFIIHFYVLITHQSQHYFYTTKFFLEKFAKSVRLKRLFCFKEELSVAAVYILTFSSMTYAASEKQIKMIVGLCWTLRPYYLWQEWRNIIIPIQRMMENPSYEVCNSLIRRMLAVKEEKEKSYAKKYWVPMSYKLNDPVWQTNLAKIAVFLFPEEEIPVEARHDLGFWRELKNRIEREELKRSYKSVADEFEDNRFAAGSNDFIFSHI